MAAASASARCLSVSPGADVVSSVDAEADPPEEDVGEPVAADGCPVAQAVRATATQAAARAAPSALPCG